MHAKYKLQMHWDWVFEPDDDTKTFGENMENHWDIFVKNHIARDESGKETILYEDRTKNAINTLRECLPSLT